MAINQNHQFEDLDGVKCAIVEKNAGNERVSFLKKILELNGYNVIIVPSPPPKLAAAESSDEATVIPENEKTFTVGVSDVRFNVTNAIYGRLLHAPDGRVVTMAYWQQKDEISDDTIPYYSWKAHP